ncbi:MAG: hypothetical protein ACHQYP_01890 [Nitrospiria bacterium]
MTNKEESEKNDEMSLHLEKRNPSSDRICAVLDFDFYLRPLNQTSRVSREDKHSSHTIDISPGGFGFLYPAKTAFEEDSARSGSISKNTIMEIYLYFQNKRFRLNAERSWAHLRFIEETRYFRYGMKWVFFDDNQEVSLKYVLGSLKNNLISD